LIEVDMPSDLLKDPKEHESDIVKEMGEFGTPKLGEEPSSFRQGIPSWAYPVRKGIEGAYGVARSVLLDPFVSSRKIAGRFQEPKLPQEMTEQQRQQKLKAGPPTLGKAVGAVSEAGTDVLSLMPVVGDEAIVGKVLGKKSIPVLLGTVGGIRRTILRGEAGEVTKKGTPIIDNILNWAKEQYRGRLWTEPTDGFPKKGAQGRFIILKGQAPGTGIKIGNLQSELDFLQKLDPDIKKAHKIYNSNKVLQDYMPEMITPPQLGGRMMFVEQMKPVGWYDIKKLPISEQKKMYANFTKHLERIDAEFNKLDIHFFDDSIVNWGMTREGKPQIMDIGGMSGSWGAKSDSGGRMKAIAEHYFDDAVFKHGPPSPKKVIPPKSVGTTKTIPDPGAPSDSFQRKADEMLAAAEREAAPAGTTTRGQPLEHLERRLEMYKSLEEAWKQRKPKASPLWIDDVKRIQKEIAARKGKAAPLDPSNIAQWGDAKVKGRLKAARTIAKDPDMAAVIQPRIEQLEKELARRQGPGDIVKEMGKRTPGEIEAAKRKVIEDVTSAEDLKGGPVRVETREDIRKAMEDVPQKDIVKEVADPFTMTSKQRDAYFDDWEGAFQKFAPGGELRYRSNSDESLYKIIKDARAEKKRTIVNKATAARHRQLKQDVLDATDELARREGLGMKGGKLDAEGVTKMYRSALARGDEKAIVFWKDKLETMRLKGKRNE